MLHANINKGFKMMDSSIENSSVANLLSTTKEDLWSNYENDAFYEEIQPEGLQKLSLKAGLSTGCDIKMLTPYWSTANSILDLGAGCGRAIDALLKNGFKGEITAVERNTSFFQHLKEKYKNEVSLLQTDIHDCNQIDSRFDVILMLWSGLADFSPEEQPVIFRKVSTLLNKGGKIIIDTMPVDVKPLQTEQFAQQSFLTRAKHSVVNTYEPTSEEIKQYANDNKLYSIELLHCITDSNRTRWLYVIG
jgi:phospholipid N-methyltransferase